MDVRAEWGVAVHIRQQTVAEAEDTAAQVAVAVGQVGHEMLVGEPPDSHPSPSSPRGGVRVASAEEEVTEEEVTHKSLPEGSPEDDEWETTSNTSQATTTAASTPSKVRLATSRVSVRRLPVAAANLLRTTSKAASSSKTAWHKSGYDTYDTYRL